jgi:ubiquinone/menaquinone biosynthesis C-methylase UbiE
VRKKNEASSVGPKSIAQSPRYEAEGWHGWDEYAPFYDWENAQTLGSRDVAFWQRLARQMRGPILELGCGTGRVTVPVARIAAVPVVGIDRSAPMLARARRRMRHARGASRLALVRGDIRALPFGDGAGFQLVMAPYGILQSLVRESDLTETLQSVVRVLAPCGLMGVDLVPDLPQWSEYRERVRLRGFRRTGRSHVTLVESVTQDRPRGLTIFNQTFFERRGQIRERRDFSLTFRTLSVPQMRERLEEAGLRVEAVHGNYDGAPWESRAEVWLILARRGGG